jgi:hypothetical protein
VELKGQSAALAGLSNGPLQARFEGIFGHLVKAPEILNRLKSHWRLI